jgi:uncharacterized protein with PQ loop repeat
MWQDIIMSTVGIIFAVVLIPQAIDCYKKKCRMNVVSCSITTIGLVIIAVCMFTLDAYYTAVMNIITACVWGACWYFSRR